MSDGSLNLRQAVRALVVDPDGQLLLVRFAFPGGTVWALPGGGIEPDEPELDALHRELAEEVGLRGGDRCVRLGANLGRHDGFLGWPVRTGVSRAGPALGPDPGLSWDALRAEMLAELRWWSLDELDELHRSPTPDFAGFALFELPGWCARSSRSDPPPNRPACAKDPGRSRAEASFHPPAPPSSPGRHSVPPRCAIVPLDPPTGRDDQRWELADGRRRNPPTASVSLVTVEDVVIVLASGHDRIDETATTVRSTI
ncbi:MAG: NUDIX hydrolase [Ilumatobacteraceae bacterium]